MTRDGVLVMTITSVHFSQLKITSLTKVLGGASFEPASHTTIANNASHSATNQLKGAKQVPKQTLNDLLHSDSSSYSHKGREMSNDSIAEVKLLQSLFLSYTGLAIKDVNEDISLAELGIDSLAAAEMSNDIQSTFSVDIKPDYLLSQTYSSLSRSVCPRVLPVILAKTLPYMKHGNNDASFSSSPDSASPPGTEVLYTPPKDSRDSSELAGSETEFASQRQKVL